MPAAKTEKPPGFIVRARRNGPPAHYWQARQDLVRAGYRPKLVRLHGDPETMTARCHVLQGEMLTWSVGQAMGPQPTYDGTFASLVRFYEAHPQSPFHKLKPGTKRVYSKTLELLMRNKGSRTVKAVDGATVGRWYDEITSARTRAWAYYTMNVLKAALAFGASKRITECALLREELRAVRFRAGKKRKEYLSHQQVTAFRLAARGMRGMNWVALCLLMQFELGLRRRDVIGEWVKDGPGVDGIRYRTMVWRDGVTWAHIDENGVFRKLVSKTAFTSEEVAVHVIADYPDLAAELAKLSADRVGPIIINEKTGLPPTEPQCRRAFRRVARKAGIPDESWMMDARAGTNTEAYEAGATEEEAMALLTHTEAKTNRNYLREKMEQSRRAAAKRIGSRTRGENG